MLINVNRKIFNALEGKPEQLMYVNECVSYEVTEILEKSLIDFKDSDGLHSETIAKNICKVISKNEKIIKEIGMVNYYHNEMTAEQYVSGYYYDSGKIVIVPFDWSMANENDEDWDYSFSLAYIL